MKIILASGSPRRRELLSMIGLDFEVIPSENDEIVPAGLTPAQTVEFLARSKAEDVGKKVPDGDRIILAADTIVYMDGKILGKPADAADACRMLRELSGRTHEVYTGVCINGECDHVKTEVTFREFGDEEIEAYVATGEPLDKAGAYGAQGKGALLVEKINGDFFNVMGLPISRVCQMLKSQGVKVI